MYINFTFADGSNPYITTTNERLWHMIRKYCIEQTSTTSFHVLGEAQLLALNPSKKISSREKRKAILRDFAIEWQYHFTDYDYSFSELIGWQKFFAEYGQKFGLIREFKENGII